MWKVKIEEMTNAEISLAVARLIWPNQTWELIIDDDESAYCFDRKGDDPPWFWYKNEQALASMAVWFASQKTPYDTATILHAALLSSDPNLALAELIIESGYKDEHRQA